MIRDRRGPCAPPPATERRTFPLHQGGDHAVNQEERHVGLAAQPRTTRCSAPISRRRRYATEPRPHSPGRSICRSGRIARGPLVRRLLAPPPRADRQTTSHGHALGRVFPQGVASSKTAPTDVLILAATPPVFTTERHAGPSSAPHVARRRPDDSGPGTHRRSSRWAAVSLVPPPRPVWRRSGRGGRCLVARRDVRLESTQPQH